MRKRMARAHATTELRTRGKRNAKAPPAPSPWPAAMPAEVSPPPTVEQRPRAACLLMGDEAAAELENQFCQFIPDAYFVTDPRGVILDWNPPAERLLDVTDLRLHLQGKPLILFVHPEDRNVFWRAVMRTRY